MKNKASFSILLILLDKKFAFLRKDNKIKKLIFD